MFYNNTSEVSAVGNRLEAQGWTRASAKGNIWTYTKKNWTCYLHWFTLQVWFVRKEVS